MNRIVLTLICIALLPSVLGATPVQFGSETLYVVSADNPSEDTGEEVCAQLGQNCLGYPEESAGACGIANPSAQTVVGYSGDKSGVYCDGAPQNGACSTLTNTCLVCPTCTKSVSCTTPIGGLYKEMYVKCGSGQCKVTTGARNTQEFLRDILSINLQLQGCPVQLPSGTGYAVSNGDNIVNIKMKNGQTEKVTMTVQGSTVTGIKRGGNTCKQQVDISEQDIDTILASSNRGQAAAYLFGNGKLNIRGCTFFTKVTTTLFQPIGRFFVKRTTPSSPPPAPAPNCGNVGEQCNNRGCFSGMCAAPEEQNSDGRWGHWNYRCIDQRDWNVYCVGRGNSPPAWACLAGVCR